jgi:Protein of unknown function (DUF4232)
MRKRPLGRVPGIVLGLRAVVVMAAISITGLLATGCTSGTKSPAANPATTTFAPVTTSTVPTTTATSASTTTSSAASDGPPCRDGQVSVSDGGGGAGLGHEDQVILFTNQSKSICTLSGYPGVAGLDAQGNQVVQAERTLDGYLGGLQNDATTPPTVTLAPGQTASAIVEGTDNPVGSAISCPNYPALLVTPPNLTYSVRLTVGLPGCSPIEVHPVVPGTSGRSD